MHFLNDVLFIHFFTAFSKNNAFPIFKVNICKIKINQFTHSDTC